MTALFASAQGTHTHSLDIHIYKPRVDMDTSSLSPTSSTSSMHSIVASLFPPKLSIRPRSLSNVTAASSRSGTPVPSIAPSTPHFLDLSPRSSEDFERPPIVDFVPRAVEYLDAQDILNLSMTTRQCRDLRTSHTFQRYLSLNGWDTDALVRRVDAAKDINGRPWMFLARSALHKDSILRQYALLPKSNEKRGVSKNKKDKLAVEKFMRILIDVTTEHDRHNFQKLSSLANTLNMSLIQFVTAIPAHDWKARYRKTFVVAAFTNTQSPNKEGECDLEALATTLDFEDSRPPQSLIASRANILYTYGCMTYSKCPSRPMTSIDYDPPHLCSSRGSTFPGLRQAIDRLACRISIRGFYQKTGGDISPMKLDVEPVGLASKSRLPFTEKQLLTLTANVSGDEGVPAWEMEGSIDRNTGVGKLKTVSGMVYELWITPWGITGQKLRGEGKLLGYFVLHWV